MGYTESEIKNLMNARRKLTVQEIGAVQAFMLKEQRIKAAKASTECSRCNGVGRISCYSHVAAGVCFKCGGTGVAR